LIIDLQWRYNVNAAIRVCRALKPFGIRWLEDRVTAQMAVNNIEELRVVASNFGVPIGTGGNMYTIRQFKELVSTGVRVWTPDVTKAGGISEGKRIVELASIYDIEIPPHNISSPIGTMANIHVASVSGTLGVMEFIGNRLPFWGDIIRSGGVVEDDFLRLTDEPGLGVEVDFDRLGRALGASYDE